VPYYPTTIIKWGFFKASDFRKLMQNLILFCTGQQDVGYRNSSSRPTRRISLAFLPGKTPRYSSRRRPKLNRITTDELAAFRYMNIHGSPNNTVGQVIASGVFEQFRHLSTFLFGGVVSRPRIGPRIREWVAERCTSMRGRDSRTAWFSSGKSAVLELGCEYAN
jgi:hypothetical protein